MKKNNKNQYYYRKKRHAKKNIAPKESFLTKIKNTFLALLGWGKNRPKNQPKATSKNTNTFDSLEEKSLINEKKKKRKKKKKSPPTLTENTPQEQTPNIEVQPPKSKNTLVGKVDFTRNKSAYILVEGREKDIFVHQKDTGGALPFDTVEVLLTDQDRGKIIRIIERKTNKFACILELSDRFAFGVPTDSKMPYHIFIPLDATLEARDKEKVLVEITEFAPKAKNPQGKVIKIFGVSGEHQAEMDAIIEEFGFGEDFPQEVLKICDDFSDQIDPEEIEKRRDFRKILTFTIDPVDAKDFDDALSFEILENGNFSVGVHIADVSFFVKPGSLLDKIAYEKGNSVYLVDRVLPMLPERLSNELCSLRPLEEKYVFSAVFEISPQGKIIDKWFGKGIIYSQKRFTYESAQEIIEGKNIDSLCGHAILTLNQLAQQLRLRRIQDGALEINSSEVKFILDEEHKPTGIYQKKSKDANFLIEEFMLLANRSVAFLLGNKEKNNDETPKNVPLIIYRVHDLPKKEKIQELKLFVQRFGYRLSEQNFKKDLNQLISQIAGKPEESIISTMLIRTMSKAIYSVENTGHYGLNFDYYTHFTSPIRRYADLLVHRSLEAFLENKTYSNLVELEKKAKHISQMEKQAAEAERESIKFKQVEWMSAHIGEVFEGLVSGMTDWGMYVETIEHHCEGMIQLKNIEQDRFEFDPKAYCIIGKKTETKIFFGDRVKIEVLGVNMLKKTIDYRFIEKIGE